MQKEITNSNRVLLNRLCDITEESLNSVENGILNILTSDEVYYDLDGKDYYTRVLFAKLGKNLGKVKLSNSIVKDLFLIDKKTNLVVSSSSVYDFDSFFGTINKYENLDIPFWKDYFKENLYKKKNIIPASSISAAYTQNTGDPNRVITFIRGLYQVQQDPLRVYAIVINESQITDLIKKLNITKDGQVYVVDSGGNIITSTDSSNMLSHIINDTVLKDLVKNNNSITTELNKIKYSVISSSSSSFNFTYIAVIPYKELIDKSRYVTGILEILGIIVLLLGCIAAVIISGKMYKPINTLVEQINKNAKSNVPKSKNEFEYISSNITNILNDSKNLSSALKTSLSFSRESVLSNFINGKYNFYDDNPDILKNFKLDMSKQNFVAFAIKINNFKEFKVRYNEYDRELMKFCISNISEELASPFGMCISASSSLICLLLNFDTIEDESWPVNLGRQICQCISTYLDFSVTVGIGSIKKDIHDIAKSYKEACDSLLLRNVNPASQVIEYYQASTPSADYYYPIEKETSIINSLKAGNYDKAVKTIEAVLNENFNRNIQYRDMNYILSELLSAIIKTVYEIGGKIQDILNLEINLNDDLFENETYGQLVEWFQSVCIRLCNYIIEQRESNNKDVLNKILDYIYRNYNSDITLETVADQFNMSYSYLSRYFKQQTGCNFIYYLYRLRIDKAKEMLKNSGFKINQIAENVGFSDVNNFIRMFKKYEGITPGKYRELPMHFM
jgi:Response regulator containing CheY-like receiver domain and AraC-type DNA-binding domain